MFAIYKREMRSYFTSPLGYIYSGIFLAVNGAVFSVFTLLQGDKSSLSSYFSSILFAFIVLIPLLTMRSFADERKTKTEQLLLTAPVTLPGMVFGKFLAAYTMFAATFLVGCTNLYTIYKFGPVNEYTGVSEVNTAQIIGYIIGILLVGAAFVAIGIFISSLTENQIVAALGTMAVMLLFLAASFLNSKIPFAWLREVTNWVSIYSRYGNFGQGIFDFSALLYYCSISFVFLFLTVRIYEKRRWE